MQWARGKFSTLITGSIIGFIAFVFVVSGVFSPKSTRGMHEGAVAGTVNGDPITISEFNRALNQRMEFFKRLGGGKISEEQLKAFRVREGVFQELVRQKLMVQEADKQGMGASDEEVRDRIREIPAFQKEGKFDVAAYKQVLAANNYTPSSFERLVREEASGQSWQNYFQSRVKVSDEEIKSQFLQANDKRTIKYVLLTNDSARQMVKVDESEVNKFLADPAKLNLAKNQYEQKKESEYKGTTFDLAKVKIAREILASEKLDQIKKINEKLATEVAAAMTADKKSDAKVNALVKPYRVEVKSTGPISVQNGSLAGVGPVPEMMKDAFGNQLNSKPKTYTLGNGVVVAIVTDTQKPDLAKLDAERGNVARQISSRKQRELYDEWMKKIMAKAKIDANPAVVGESA